MSPPPSTPFRGVSSEGLAREAALVRARSDRMIREVLAPDPAIAAPVLGRGTDPAPFLAGVSSADGPDAVLLAEAATLAAIQAARRAHLSFLVTTPGERFSVAPISLASRLRGERDGVRRAGLWSAVERAETEGRKVALAVVDALRQADASLLEGRASAQGNADRRAAGSGRSGLLSAIGWVTRDPRASATSVLRVTADAYRELRVWRSKAILDRSSEVLRGSEHAALTRTERADAILPLPDREGIASRWCAASGLALPSLAGGLPTPDPAAPPLRLLLGDPDVRARFVGAPDPDTHGLLAVLSAVGELSTVRQASRGPIAEALGATRQHGAIAAALVRRLALSGPFLIREATVDRASVEEVCRELLYLELERMRRVAVETLALEDALSREPGLGERIADTYAKYLGTSRSPELAPHRAAEAFDAEAPRHLEAALFECVLEARLRDTHDEDWFRNPRAGATLSGAIDGVRALGPSALLSVQEPELDAALERALDTRVRAWFRAARA